MTKLRRFVSLHRWLSIALAAAVVLAIGAGVAYGVASSGGSTNAATTSPTTVAGGASGRGGHHVSAGKVRGKVTAISGTTLTVQTRNAGTVTVVIGSKTKFGTKSAPIDRSSLAVGDQVVVAGPRSGTTVTATRITLAGHKGTTSPASTSTTVPNSG